MIAKEKVVSRTNHVCPGKEQKLHVAHETIREEDSERSCCICGNVLSSSLPQKEQVSSLHPSVVQVENALTGNCMRT